MGRAVPPLESGFVLQHDSCQVSAYSSRVRLCGVLPMLGTSCLTMISPTITMMKIIKHKAGVAAQRLRTLLILTEDQGSIPRTYSVAHSHLQLQGF